MLWKEAVDRGEVCVSETIENIYFFSWLIVNTMHNWHSDQQTPPQKINKVVKRYNL